MSRRRPAMRRGASGKPVAIAIVALALVLAGVAVGYHHLRQRRALEFWGSRGAAAILNAEKVTALQLTDAAVRGLENDAIDVGGKTFGVVARREVGKAPGFSHVRRSLVNDASFAWATPLSDQSAEWRYALIFGDDEAVVLFSSDFTQAGSAESAKRVNSAPLAAALRSFVEPYFGSAESARGANTSTP